MDAVCWRTTDLGSPLLPAVVAVELAAVGSPALVVFPHGPWDCTVASFAGVATGGHVNVTPALVVFPHGPWDCRVGSRVYSRLD